MAKVTFSHYIDRRFYLNTRTILVCGFKTITLYLYLLFMLVCLFTGFLWLYVCTCFAFVLSVCEIILNPVERFVLCCVKLLDQLIVNFRVKLHLIMI